MDKTEAVALLKVHLATYRLRPYRELLNLLGEPEVVELRGRSGATYQVEVSVHWDGDPGGDIHVIGSIDDGGWRAFLPLADGFIVAPDGRFIGE